MDFTPDFPAHIWEPFAKSRPPILCGAGYLIYLQNTEATCFYYLKSGRVKSFMQSEDGEERILHVYGPGSLFGEASFFDELPRVSSAMALTDCQIVAIDRELVTQEIAKNPELALAMMKYLARTVRLLSGQVDQMAFRPARWRVGRFLLSLSPDGGTAQCTQEDIAAAVSVSRVTVSRILNAFAREGLVEVGYGTVQVLNPKALDELCKLS